MSAAKEQISVYVMSSGEGASTDEKILLLAEKYLSEQNGGSKTVTVARTELGKPYFTDPEGLFVSVSHSGDYFVCALGSCPVGVDVQTHSTHRRESEAEKTERLVNIAKRFFHPRELPLLQEDAVSRFFALWTAKESYVKLTGQGIDNSFSQICPLPDNTEVFLRDGEVTRWSALGVLFEKRQLTPQDTLCVCAEKPFELTVYNMM
ncbi:MAG: 4'-phosphopantetheinyl transferase superfamily protein [Oscillospiraceae bacterium]|nr:4'-phosphopantetheinyl transferase superfamily protein [Oscillospiraceae bacterium]MBQ3048744.1 4'-phosphopantetheinyl transferase superfamily protein [Oscillospiraceae bacterium]MBQ9939309.1 4'-phosphopantetheinyl transferase superfamily protein [Oscillospiraceae bacterium]